MIQLDYLDKVVEYIEENIQNDIRVEEISNHTNVSKFHLQRMFKALVGMGMMEYVRARKMTQSLQDLKTTDHSIIRVAQEYGYNYEQSFTRAFKKQFNLSPNKYRKSPSALKIVPKLELKFLVTLTDALIGEPFYVTKPGFRLGGLCHTVSIADKFKGKPTEIGNDFFYNSSKKVKNPVEANTYYGYTMADIGRVDSTKYFTGIEINDKSVLPESLDYIDIPERDYIVFRFIGFFPPNQITWHHLEEIWKVRDDFFTKHKGYESRVLNYFELIDGNVCSDDYCQLDLYVPI